MQKVSARQRARLSSLVLLVVISGSVHPLYGGEGDGTLVWQFDAGFSVDTPPAIGPEGVIYIGANRDLIAVNPDGTEKWRFTADQSIAQAPAIFEDGTIYAVSLFGTLYALNPDGMLKWTFTPDPASTPSSEIALAADGTIYYAVSSTVYAVNPDGSKFWEALRDSSFGITGGLSIGLDGMVLPISGPVLFGLDPVTGQQEFQFTTPTFGNPAAAGALAEDGTIYIGKVGLGDNIVAVNPDGTEKWRASGEAQITNSPATGVNGDVYVPVNFKASQGMDRGFVIAFDKDDGSEKWRYETDGGVSTTPLVGFDNIIYFGTTSNKLIALDSNGNELWVFDPQAPFGAPRINSSPNIAPDGTLYFGSTDTKLYAVRSSSAGLAGSSWPKFQRDVFNSGRFGSDTTRRNWFAPHGFQVTFNNEIIGDTTVTIRHTGGSAGSSRGTTASFRIDVLNRDGTDNFSVEDSVEPGEVKDILLQAPDGSDFQGAIIVEASIKDGTVLAPFLTWRLEVTQPFEIGAFFSDPTEAALVHHFPGESNDAVGLGIAVQNIGENAISCDLEFFNADGSDRAQTDINLAPRGSRVGFFDNVVLPAGPAGDGEGFKGSATFSCDAPVIAVSVNQNKANAFPTDRITIKGIN